MYNISETNKWHYWATFTSSCQQQRYKQKTRFCKTAKI